MHYSAGSFLGEDRRHYRIVLSMTSIIVALELWNVVIMML